MRHPTRLALLLLAATACYPTNYGIIPAEVKLSDANLVAIVLMTDNTDLSYARLVPGRARNDAVKAYAQRMLTDHTIFNNRVNDIAVRYDIRQEDCATSLHFRDSSAVQREMLKHLEGAAFDAAYAENEVQFHTELLTVIDIGLLPNVRNPELREFLTQLKPAIRAHLAHAEQMRASLASGT